MPEFEVRLEILNKNRETVFMDFSFINIDRKNIKDICDTVSRLHFDGTEASDCIIDEGLDDPDNKNEVV